MFVKLSMARACSWGAWITSKTHGKTELNVNRLTATSFSKFGARYEQSIVSYKCNQGHGWISHNHMYKTSLLKQLKANMDRTVASCLHGIQNDRREMTWQKPKSLKTAVTRWLLCMLVLVTKLITKIHGKHPCNDGMA